MSRSCKLASAFAISLTMIAAQAGAQTVLPWRLADYPNGGRTLTDVVAATLIKQGDLIEPTCTQLKPGNVQQIASGVSGIGMSIANSDAANSSLIVDRLPRCCEALAAENVDMRITLGAAIALEARELAEEDMPAAQEVELVVGLCDDDILERSYELARGQDNLGLLIAQESPETNPSLVTPPVPPASGGGVPSTN